MAMMRQALQRGALTGALLFGGLQLAAIAWAGLSSAGDDNSQRAAVRVESLSTVARLLFVAELLAWVALMGALLGLGQAALRCLWLGNERISRSSHVPWVALTLVAVVIHRLIAAPALMGSALPFPKLQATLVATLPPFAMPAAALLLVAVALFAGRRRVVALAFVPAVALPSTEASVPPNAGTASRPPNVLILAADSIRPDHLSGLGYARKTTPNLDQLMTEGVTFDRTMAALAGTSPSWISILTGRYPHHHGVRHMFPTREQRPDSLRSLPVALKDRGYQTAVVSDYAGDFFGTFELGFDEERLPPALTLQTLFERELLSRSPLALAVLEPLPESLRPQVFRYLLDNADPERLAGVLTDTLRRQQREGRPFFTVAFFSATHIPFAAPWPAAVQFADPLYGGEHRFSYGVNSLAGLKEVERSLPPADVEQIRALYDGALASVDEAIGQVLGTVDELGLRDDTVVVFLSDHGENLFEPGQTTLHGKWFRGGDEANRVPLILRGPGLVPGLRLSSPVSLIDVAPTLALATGVELLRPDGRSLLGAARGEPLEPRAVFAETAAWLNGPPLPDGVLYPTIGDLLETEAGPSGDLLVVKPRYDDVIIRAKHRALWEEKVKLIYEPTRTGARFLLYDLEADPHQTQDLMGQHPESERLKLKLLEFLEADRERELNGRLHVTRRQGG